MRPIKQLLKTCLHKTRLLIIFSGEMYIILILLVAVIIATLMALLSYVPLLVLNNRKITAAVYSENLLMN